MRPIDADNLLIALSNAFCTGNIGYREAENVVNDQDTIAPEILRPAAWISVKDRLPDFYEKVFVYLNHWSGEDVYFAFYNPDRGLCDCGGYFDDGTNNDGEPLRYETAGVNVTHWMPKPKPPEDTE